MERLRLYTNPIENNKVHHLRANMFKAWVNFLCLNKANESVLPDLDTITFRLTVASVRRWRLLSQGPKCLKIGEADRYKPEHISAWLESRPTSGHQEAA